MTPGRLVMCVFFFCLVGGGNDEDLFPFGCDSLL